MESPKLSNRTWNIRNPSLRSFYMDSSFSNVHTIVEETQPGAPRRSPRLAGISLLLVMELYWCLLAKQASAIPPPPPPPPIPLLPCPPPPPPLPSLINGSGSQGSTPVSGQVKNRNKLQQMQNRLRTRMMKKTGGEAESKTSTDTVLNFKVLFALFYFYCNDLSLGSTMGWDPGSQTQVTSCRLPYISQNQTKRGSNCTWG